MKNTRKTITLKKIHEKGKRKLEFLKTAARTRMFGAVSVVIIVLAQCGCGEKKVDLMKNASPETSALALYCYDGADIKRTFIYDTKTVEDILKDFHEANVELVEAESQAELKKTVPYYGLEISDKEGKDLTLAWSNGYAYCGNDSVYEFDYDFEDLKDRYDWQDEDIFDSLTVFPNNRQMSLKHDGWDAEMLSESNKLEPSEGISISLVSHEENKLVISFKNNSGSEWCFGKYYSLEVCLEGVWYQIPVSQNYGFEDIGIILENGKDMEQTYDLTMYGELPEGDYRIVVEDMTLEFQV